VSGMCQMLGRIRCGGVELVAMMRERKKFGSVVKHQARGPRRGNAD
jgi:hypothetical protein